MKKQLILLTLIILANDALAQDYSKNIVAYKTPPLIFRVDSTPQTPAPNNPPPDDLSGLGSYNFGGGNTGFSTLQAQVDYGFKYALGSKGKNYFEFRPSISTPVNSALSKNYIPALMLPGSAAISINTYLPVGDYLIFSPINLGLKFLSGFGDSAKTIIQHNIRTGFAFQVAKLLLFQAQFSWAWHNSTDDSQRNYNFIFNKLNSDIKYVTLTLQGRVSPDAAKTPSYIVIEWRNLLNPGQFKSLQNSRIFSIGFTTRLNLSTGNQAR